MSFSVLESTVDVHKSFLVEASAGTGKTFTIEFLVLRHLLEKDVASLKNISVITFTRACARELKHRIRARLEETRIEIINQHTTKDFIEKLCIHDEKKREKLLSTIDEALFSYNDALICTIHQFAFYLLKDYIQEYTGESFSWLDVEEEKQILKDLFDCLLQEVEIHPIQIALVLSQSSMSIEYLIENIQKRLFRSRKQDIEGFSVLVEKLHKEIEDLKRLDISLDTLQDILRSSASHFQGCQKRDGSLQEQLEKEITNFSCWVIDNSTENFKKFIRNPFFASKWFQDIKARSKGLNKEEEALIHFYQLKIEPILKKLTSEEEINDLLAAILEKKFIEYLLKKHLCTRESVLKILQVYATHEQFCTYVQERFSLIIVDEFQDTDPVQWAILKKLFLNSAKTTVQLVGDPKQAIYRFRDADVYNFLDAKHCFSDTAQSLMNNWRVTKSLAYALNALFDTDKESVLLLPSAHIRLSLPKIQVPDSAEVGVQKSCKICICTHEAKRSRKWPNDEVEAQAVEYISDEIKKIYSQDASYSSIAILVRDHNQGERVTKILESKQIPVRKLKGDALCETEAYNFWARFVRLLKSPKNRTVLFEFFTAFPFYFSQEEAQKILQKDFNGLCLYSQYIDWMMHAIKVFQEKGFGTFITHILITPIFTYTLQELFKRNPREQEAFERIFSWLTEHYVETCFDIEEALILLYKKQADERAATFIDDPRKEGIVLTTLHKSKGLEFNYVFALGASTRSQVDDKSDNELEEYEAEKQRLFYVACTRAKRQLILFLFSKSYEKDTIIPYSLSPFELHLQAIAHSTFQTFKQLYEYTGKSFVDIVYEKYSSCDAIQIEKYETSDNILPIEVSERESIKDTIACSSKLIEHNKIRTITPYSFFHSFTKEKKEYVEHFMQNSSSILPTGKATGVYVHKILDQLFKSFWLKDNALFRTDWLKSQAALFFDSESDLIVSMIEKMLITPMFSYENHMFSFLDIDWKSLYVETPFLQKDGKGYIQGTVDLAFQYKNKWYIVDWKLKDFGDIAANYSLDTYKKFILDEGLNRQAEIYMNAIVQDKNECAGFYFIFLRSFLFTTSSSHIFMIAPTLRQKFDSSLHDFEYAYTQ